MRRFVKTCQAVAATTKKSLKVALVSELFQDLSVEDAAQAAIFLTGRAFPNREERVLGVGGSQLAKLVAQMAGADTNALGKSYRVHGDLGDMAEHLLLNRSAAAAVPTDVTPGTDVSLATVASVFHQLPNLRTAAQKMSPLKDLFQNMTPGEIKYAIKIITGDLRIGLKESLVEEAIAKAFDRPLAAVRRANMLTGDIAETLSFAAADNLMSVQIRLFHPIGFMLATPVETANEILPGNLSNDVASEDRGAVLVEEKYDGIRAQVHKSAAGVKVFSRTLDEVTEFPELNPPFAKLPGDFILDGEILAWNGSGPLPFTELQKRLGRKQLDLYLRHEIPVRFAAFDLIYQDGELLLDEPLAGRRARLEKILAPGLNSAVYTATAIRCDSAAAIESAFRESLAVGHEGIVVKMPQSLYTPGRRGRSWFKLKEPFATLDVVVTAVEYGHGKRHGLLSDYTFSVRDGNRLLTIGKAYSGLTDAEIKTGTEYFLQHSTEDLGARRLVEPTVVMEVAFNNIQKSQRHESGYALRFPRILRLRPDKPVAEIDTLDRVAQLYSRQITLPRYNS
ncbi:MAG: ATP-dependent DNA ligase [Acidobacteriota bacterium]|nr:ATP-dependent DNA ligase [Acidobacteriota bacterium]